MTLMIEKSWRDLLREELEKPYIAELKQFLKTEKEAGFEIYPPVNDVFRAFLLTPFEKVKVVIVGQDPYHGEGQAHGLAFSVQRNVPVPPSLKNIYKELKSDLEITQGEHGDLSSWARHGVLLLNATLTVRKGEPKSHYGRGWETFTDKVIDLLSDREDPIVFMLWGRSAREKCERILNTKKHPHLILEAAHPSPFSATQFLGCRHFSKANAFLEKNGKERIQWEKLD